MKRKEILAPALAVILLGGLAAHEGILGRPSADTHSYHDAVRREVLDAPYYIGTWAGADRSVPRGAVALLRPNVILSRRFEEVTSGRSLELLIVQCQDARDLLGHYPPICYKAQGWVQQSGVEKDWVVGDLVLKGMEYTFEFESLTRTSKIVIVNFMVLPGDEIARGMDEVNRAAQDRRKKFYGAAQFQLLFDAAVPEEERDRVLRSFAEAHMPIIDTIRYGMQP